MKLKAIPIEILPDDPFKNDLLKRKVCAEQLTELLKSSDEPLVLFINAAYGNGKTTFMKMWREQLRLHEFKTLYFNAWENDYSDDALVSLIGELSSGMDELRLEKAKAQKAKKYLDKAKKIGAGLVKKSIPFAIRLGTGGVLDGSEIKLGADTVSKLSELTEDIAKDQIEQYETSKKTINGFKEQLKKFAEEVTTTATGNKGQPLTIMIDELDRCRPPYALQVLEKIKHLFHVSGIVFVIAGDKEQLGCSIQSLYGQGTNVNGYLRRFLDFDFNLPVPEPGAFCSAQFARFGLEEFFSKRALDPIKYDRANLTDAFTAFFSGFGLTLREQEHCFAMVSLALRSTTENYQIFPFLLSILIAIKIRNHRLYSDFVASRVDHHEILKYMRVSASGRNFLDDNYGYALEVQLAVCRSRDRGVSELIPIYEATAADNSKEKWERDRAKIIVQFINTHHRSLRDAPGILDYLVQKIDLASRFET